MDVDPHQIVSVKHMAQMLHISRSRLYQLIHASILLPPVYDTTTKRPFYCAEMIQTNLDAKRQNRGINGNPVLFYSPRTETAVRRTPKTTSKHVDLIDGMKALGLDASEATVEAALNALYPDDHGASVDEGERLRHVFRHLRRSNRVEHSEDNVCS